MNGQLLYNSFITPPVQISAEPTDINELAEYSNDPRVVTNLLDGINQTRDDVHMWLAPFTPGKNHIVRIRFYIPQALALIRIWVSHTGLAGGGGGGWSVTMGTLGPGFSHYYDMFAGYKDFLCNEDVFT